MKHLFVLLCAIVTLCNPLTGQQVLNTQLLGQYDRPTSDLPVFQGVQFNDIWGYASPGGKEIAIIGNSQYFVFIDVTNPATPTEIYRHAPGNPEIWRDIKTYKQYAYGVCDGCFEGLNIYDLSDLDCGGTISHVNQITAQFGESHNIYIDVDNHRLYAVGVPGAVDMYVYDLLPDPTNPVLLASVDFNVVSGLSSNLYIHDVYVRDNIAYASHGNTGYFIWDMNDVSNTGNSQGNNPGTIELLASDEYNGYNHSSWVTEDGNYAIVAEEVPTGLPLISVDLTDLSNGSIIDVNQFSDHLEPNGASTAHNPFIRNNFVFLSYYEDGLKIYDLADPVNPSLHAYYDTYSLNDNGDNYPGGYEGAWGCYPFLPSGNILVSDITFGLHVISMTGAETCADGIQNQDETGVDCGGNFCLPCDTCTDGIQNQDETGIDCGGTICCAPCATCNDGIQNQDETGIDCGGSICPACPTCSDGIQNQDETGIDCGGAICAACPTCSDGIQNQDETGIDCGGAICPACPTCSDGIQNQDETGVDCGGATCPACPTCSDGIQNQDETGIDCGGATCPACPTCSDGIQNQDETGVDCGGITCPACPTCSDGIQNQDETGVDCGGTICPACPNCSDGLQNGTETGVDCGGSCSPCVASTCDEFSNDDFETNTGIWQIGGLDASRTMSALSPAGAYSMRIRDDNGLASSIYTQQIDFSQADSIQISFSYQANSMESGESFIVEISADGGASFTTVKQLISGADFSNNTLTGETITIPGGFSTNTVIRIRCDASSKTDQVYLDNIVLESCETDCIPSLTELNNPAINTSQAVDIFINTNGKVATGQNIDYTAGQYIMLSSNFEVEIGSVFHAYISPCQ